MPKFIYKDEALRSFDENSQLKSRLHLKVAELWLWFV